jgi:membrane protease YdiL (CAAX protease family)
LSAIVSSLLFGTSHHFVPPNIPLDVVPIDIAIGLLLAYSYSKRGLWFTIGLHFAWNTFPGSVFGLINPSISIIKLSHNYPGWTMVSGTLIDPMLLFFLFTAWMFFVWSKSDYMISLDSIVI